MECRCQLRQSVILPWSLSLVCLRLFKDCRFHKHRPRICEECRKRPFAALLSDINSIQFVDSWHRLRNSKTLLVFDRQNHRRAAVQSFVRENRVTNNRHPFFSFFFSLSFHLFEFGASGSVDKPRKQLAGMPSFHKVVRVVLLARVQGNSYADVTCAFSTYCISFSLDRNEKWPAKFTCFITWFSPSHMT